MKAWFAALVCVVCLGASGAMANGPFSVVRMVNDVPITRYELDQRKALLQVLGAPAETAGELAMSQLTEDRLKMQEAQAVGMSLQEEAYAEALASFAETRQLSPEALRARMAQGGVDEFALKAFVTTGVLWRDLVNIRFRGRATPSEADLETILNFAASARQESVFIREIAIPFAERGEQGARDLAQNIADQVRGGARFQDLARRFSRTPTAAQGGDVGWTPARRLPPLFAGQIIALSPGEVTNPIAVPQGMLVLQLVDIREEPISPNSAVTISYTRLDVPLPQTGDVAAAQAEAQALAEDLENCLEAEGRFADFGPASGRYGPEVVSAISPEIAMALAGLDADESAALPVSDAGISVITLCNRAATSDPEAIEELERQVFNQRMNNYASSYLQELLADAIITDR